MYVKKYLILCMQLNDIKCDLCIYRNMICVVCLCRLIRPFLESNKAFIPFFPWSKHPPVSFPKHTKSWNQCLKGTDGEQEMPNIVMKSSNVHSPSFTWNLKEPEKDGSKRISRFQGAFFRFHVKLWEGIIIYHLPPITNQFLPFFFEIPRLKKSQE